jgi:hypothetical protein
MLHSNTVVDNSFSLKAAYMFQKIIAQNVSEEHGSTFGACSVLGNSEKYICKRESLVAVLQLTCLRLVQLQTSRLIGFCGLPLRLN